jgi:type VI secretion system protein
LSEAIRNEGFPMSLILKVVSYKGLPPAEALAASFDRQGGMIGRSPDNQFVLPDPDKFISRRHASIQSENGVYSLTDTSTAGTYLSNKDLLLQHDTVTLADGDRLKIGDYELVVQIAGEPKAEQSPFFSEGAESPCRDAPRDSPFAFDNGEPDRRVVPPFASSRNPTPEGASFIEQPDAAPFHESFIPPDVQPAPDLPQFNMEELLRDLDAPASVAVRQPPDIAFEVPDDFLKGDSDAQEHDAVPEPAAIAAPPNASEPGVVAAPVSPPKSKHNSRGAAAVRLKAPVLEGDEVPVGAVDDVMCRKAKAAMTSSPMAAQLATPPAEAAVRAPSAVNTAAANAALFKQFLKGAGISDEALVSPEEIPAVMQSLGALFRDLVDGMMTVLRARSELKSQLRVTVTTLRPVDNNPLKFSASVEDALRILFARKHAGFIDPQEAVREGYSDIMNHQLAMVAGMQASLAELLKRFAPQTFEKPFEEGIVFQKKAKCWDAYSKAYPGLVSEALEDFFGETFADVYEQQMRVLRPARNKN